MLIKTSNIKLINFLETLFKGFFFLLFSFPILPHSVQSITIISFSLLAVILYNENFKIRLLKYGYRSFIYSTSWFLFFIITLLYSSNIEEGINQILKCISLLLLPFIFYFFTPSSYFKDLKKVGIVFILSNCIFLLIVYLRVIWVNSMTCFPELQLMGWLEKIVFIIKKNNTIIFSCYNLEEKGVFLLHKVYTSMNLMWCLILLYFFLLKEKARLIIIGLISVIIFFVLFLLFQRSVVNVTLLMLFASFWYFYFVKSKLNRVKRIIVVSLTAVTISSLIFKFEIHKLNFVSKDVVPALKFIKSINDGKVVEGSDERWYLNLTNIELIKKNPIFGQGIGDVQDELNKVYNEKKDKNIAYKKAYEEELNSHNYFAYVLQTGGLIAFGLFCWMLLYYFKISYTALDILFLSFLIVLITNMLFENILYRINGILFMTLFSSFLLMKNILVKENE